LKIGPLIATIAPPCHSHSVSFVW